MSAALAHLMLLSAWAGVVLAESVVELLPRRVPSIRDAAIRLHFAIDLVVELPLLVAVVASGVWLASGRPLDARLLVKIGAGLVAVTANGVCVAAVIRRARLLAGGALPAAVDRWSKVVLGTAVVGLPFAVLALLLGFRIVGS